jgi:hypothetical protein
MAKMTLNELDNTVEMVHFGVIVAYSSFVQSVNAEPRLRANDDQLNTLKCHKRLSSSEVCQLPV